MKFLKSKAFIIVTPLVTLIFGLIAGYLLGVTQDMTILSRYVFVEYIFSARFAIGYWLFALIISLVVFLLCIAIQNQLKAKEQ